MKVRLRIFAALLAVVCSVAHALDSVPKTEYRQRRVALASKLDGGVAVVFAAEEPVLDFMPYRQDEDFYYLTGWNEPGAALVIIGPGPERTTRLGDVVPAHGYSEILFLPCARSDHREVHRREDGRGDCRAWRKRPASMP